MRVEALDGGDGDATGVIDASGAELLDVVELVKEAAVVGCFVGAEFIHGAGAQITAIHQEEDALGFGVFD